MFLLALAVLFFRKKSVSFFPFQRCRDSLLFNGWKHVAAPSIVATYETGDSISVGFARSVRRF